MTYLAQFFDPGSIAIVGVSRGGFRFGGVRFLSFLKETGFKGSLYPINPKADEILGIKVYPDLTSLPESIGNLTDLVTLDLGHNDLTSLPLSIGKLRSLTHFLYLSHNQLKSLPKTISELSNLKYLNITHNQFTILPESICHLANLRELRL